MAYLRELVHKCRECATARATVELVDRWNGSRGQYCRKCGMTALKIQSQHENPTVTERDTPAGAP